MVVAEADLDDHPLAAVEGGADLGGGGTGLGRVGELEPEDADREQLEAGAADGGVPREVGPAVDGGAVDVEVALAQLVPRGDAFGQVRRLLSRTNLRPSAVVEVSSSSSMSSADGPSSRLPCTVGETRTPLPILVGHWNMVMVNGSSAMRSMR